MGGGGGFWCCSDVQRFAHCRKAPAFPKVGLRLAASGAGGFGGGTAEAPRGGGSGRVAPCPLIFGAWSGALGEASSSGVKGSEGVSQAWRMRFAIVAYAGVEKETFEARVNDNPESRTPIL